MTETSSGRSEKKSPKAASKPALPAQSIAASQAEPKVLDLDEALRLLRRGAPFLGLFITVIVGLVVGVAPALLTLSALVLLLAIFAIWSSLQSISGNATESGTDLLSISFEGAEDEQKRFLLRALKDLEFERSLGKISEEDYEDLKRVYRTQAKEALKSADVASEPARAKAEALVKTHLEKLGLVAFQEGQESKVEVTSDASSTTTEEETRPAKEASNSCLACKADNDVDAVFCKKCGNKLNPPQSVEGETKP